MTDLVDSGITVKVEYTENEERPPPPPPIPSPPKNECLWCAKKLVIKSTIPGFCSETCFTTSRRARFKKEKFGIDTVPKRPTPSKPEATSSKNLAAGRKDLQGKINYHRQLHRQRQLQERLAKRNKGESLKRKYNQARLQRISNDDDLPLSDLTEITALSNLMKRAQEAVTPEMVSIGVQTDKIDSKFSEAFPAITMVPVFIPMPIPIPEKLLATKNNEQTPLDLTVKKT